MNKTIKEDWVTEHINVGGYTSSSKNLAENFNIVSGNTAELRFVFYENDFLFLVTVNTVDKSIIKTISESTLFSRLKKQFFDLDIIGYDMDNFIVWDDTSILSYNSDTLVNFFKGKNETIADDVGVFKELNKSYNDDFQDWTRKHLSRKCVINDIDGFYFHSNGDMPILELKRIDTEKTKDSLFNWMPYVDDYRNYSALIRMKDEYKTPYYVICYAIIPDKYVAMHTINLVSKNEIVGKRIIMEANALHNFPFGFRYKSHNSRY